MTVKEDIALAEVCREIMYSNTPRIKDVLGLKAFSSTLGWCFSFVFHVHGAAFFFDTFTEVDANCGFREAETPCRAHLCYR